MFNIFSAWGSNVNIPRNKKGVVFAVFGIIFFGNDIDFADGDIGYIFYATVSDIVFCEDLWYHNVFSIVSNSAQSKRERCPGQHSAFYIDGKKILKILINIT